MYTNARDMGLYRQALSAVLMRSWQWLKCLGTIRMALCTLYSRLQNEGFGAHVCTRAAQQVWNAPLHMHAVCAFSLKRFLLCQVPRHSRHMIKARSWLLRLSGKAYLLSPQSPAAQVLLRRSHHQSAPHCTSCSQLRWGRVQR